MNKRYKLLILDSSELIRSFVKEKFEQFGMEVLVCKDPFDALIKMKNEIPDCVIIDYYLIEKNGTNILNEKKDYKTVADIPVILLAAKIDINTIKNAAKLKVNKFFEKPIKPDLLIKSVSELLNVEIEGDTTPAILEVNYNNGILFIESGLGLNSEKIETLKFKIKEILSINNKSRPKTILMLNDIEIKSDKEKIKFKDMINTIIDNTGGSGLNIKILTKSDIVKELLAGFDKFKNIETVDDISKAIDNLDNANVEELISQDNNTIKGMIDINESASPGKILNKAVISIVDDDEFIRDLAEAALMPLEADIHKYANGKLFIDDLKNHIPDLIFLDLMMPVMSGFDVLDKLKTLSYSIPTIIFSTMNQKDTILKLMKYGVRNFIVKPIDPGSFINKAIEALKSDF